MTELASDDVAVAAQSGLAVDALAARRRLDEAFAAQDVAKGFRRNVVPDDPTRHDRNRGVGRGRIAVEGFAPAPDVKR